MEGEQSVARKNAPQNETGCGDLKGSLILKREKTKREKPIKLKDLKDSVNSSDKTGGTKDSPVRGSREKTRGNSFLPKLLTVSDNANLALQANSETTSPPAVLKRAPQVVALLTAPRSVSAPILFTKPDQIQTPDSTTPESNSQENVSSPSIPKDLEEQPSERRKPENEKEQTSETRKSENDKELPSEKEQPSQKEQPPSEKELEEKKIQKRLAQRKERAAEMLETEKTYVKSLETIFVTIIKVLREKANHDKEKILHPNEIMDIFSNWETIKTLHSKLLVKIQERMDNWESVSRLGDIFNDEKNTGFIKLYKHYVNNFDKSIVTLETCKKKNKAFLKMISELDYSERWGGLNLQSFLILPVQRIPRYVLLLSDLLKYTDKEHVDYDDLTSALGTIKELADYINKNKSDADNINKILAVEEKLIGLPKSLVEQGRIYLREGCLKTNKSDKLYVFLFSDALVYTKAKGKKYTYKGRINLPVSSLNLNIPPHESHHFELLSTAGTFKFTVDPPQEKDSFIKAVKDAIDSARQYMLNSAFSGPQVVLEGSKKFQQLREEENLKKRRNAAQHFVDSEVDYVNTLDLAINNYMLPMRALPRDVISLEEISDIFINLEDVQKHHQSLLKLLLERMEKWEENPQIGDIFLEAAEPMFESYWSYLHGFSKSKQAIETCLNNTNFAAFFKELEAHEKKTLEELLVHPLRRLSNYYLLLQELLGNTTSRHADYENLKTAVDQLKHVTEQMDQERLREASERSQRAVLKRTQTTSVMTPTSRRQKSFSSKKNSQSSSPIIKS